MPVESIQEQISRTKAEVSAVFEKASLEAGRKFDFRESSLAMLLTEVLYETELPRFGVKDITSVKNETVQGKADLVMQIPEISESAIPESLLKQYALDFNEETIKKAPWVNIIHAWMKVLNELNTFSAMQRGEAKISANTIASVAHVLYGFTTNSDGDPFIRSESQFLSGEKYAETVKRESGTEGANPTRHVNFEEMKYIIGVVKKGFLKDK